MTPKETLDAAAQELGVQEVNDSLMMRLASSLEAGAAQSLYIDTIRQSLLKTRQEMTSLRRKNASLNGRVKFLEDAVHSLSLDVFREYQQKMSRREFDAKEL